MIEGCGRERQRSRARLRIKVNDKNVVISVSKRVRKSDRAV